MEVQQGLGRRGEAAKGRSEGGGRETAETSKYYGVKARACRGPARLGLLQRHVPPFETEPGAKDSAAERAIWQLFADRLSSSCLRSLSVFVLRPLARFRESLPLLRPRWPRPMS